MRLLAGIAIFLMSPIIAKATPITDYDTVTSGVITKYSYAWTGTTYGNYAQVTMNYLDTRTFAYVGQADFAYDNYGWAQTKQVSYVNLFVTSEHRTYDDYKTSQ
jgi:hypothetical protein